MSDIYEPCGNRLGGSSPTSRKIDSIRRMAGRLKAGKSLYDINYFFAIADHMELVYEGSMNARLALIEIDELIKNPSLEPEEKFRQIQELINQIL